MSAPYYSDESITLHLGDSLAVLKTLPDQSVDCCVTSPPYFGLRDYGEAGQYGLEASPAEYVKTMRSLFAEVRRVLTDDGTLWLNIGDSYSTNLGQGSAGPSSTIQGGSRPSFRRNGAQVSPARRRSAGSVPQKNLLGIPWRTAFALQEDGWILRNDIIWAKPNAMPESVTDRLSTRHEHVFMFSKRRTYWFDLNPIRETHSDVAIQRAQPHRTAPGRSAREGLPYAGIAGAQTLNLAQMNHPNGRNPGDVWTVATQPFSEAHFAVMPQVLAERAILAGCKPGGVVLDPFSGSGTTGLAATKHGRRYLGIDLSRDYLDLSLRTRFANATLTFPEASA
jgi:DNA modification methylase